MRVTQDPPRLAAGPVCRRST